ncbi:MAG: hypothetical protein ACM3XN_04460 [Chloroflexota bacterium]
MTEREIDVTRPEPEGYSYSDCCERLGIAPHTFRQILFEYSDIIGEEGDESQTLSGESFDRLQRVLALRNGGATPEQIRAVFLPATTAEPIVPSLMLPDAALPEDPLLARLEELTRELRLSEERRREDRDRVLMAMVRAQQEIEHLRYELAATASRRDRKKKGFWARLFDI